MFVVGPVTVPTMVFEQGHIVESWRRHGMGTVSALLAIYGEANRIIFVKKYFFTLVIIWLK